MDVNGVNGVYPLVSHFILHVYLYYSKTFNSHSLVINQNWWGTLKIQVQYVPFSAARPRLAEARPVGRPMAKITASPCASVHI